MPTYEYQAVDRAAACAHCRDGFEQKQAMRDAPLAACPQCGKPVRRAITVPHVNFRPSERAQLSDKNLKRHGFQKLMKDDSGKYRNVLK